jgi:hypothetical protein
MKIKASDMAIFRVTGKLEKKAHETSSCGVSGQYSGVHLYMEQAKKQNCLFFLKSYLSFFSFWTTVGGQ